MRTERVTSRAICALIKIISLVIFYFGQELSVSLQRGCRLAPLQSISSLRNTVEGSKVELSPFFLTNCLFFALCLQHQEYKPGAEKRHVTGFYSEFRSRKPKVFKMDPV